MTTSGIHCLAISFVLSLVLVSLARAMAFRLNVMDQAGDPLKIHSKPVPYMGGVGFGLAFLLVVGAWWTLGRRWSAETVGVLCCVVSMTILGLVDDVRGMRPGRRLACQLAAGLLMWASGFRVNIVPVPPVSMVLTAVFVAGLINAVNMFDGLDGLAGGAVSLSAVGFGLVFIIRGLQYATPAFALVGVLLGFLVFNFEPASIFMGDAGAYLLGVILSLFAIVVMEGGDIRSSLAAILLIGAPLFDAGITIVRRRMAGEEVTKGDRNHVYDLLHQRTQSVRCTVLAFYLLQAVLVGAGVWVGVG
jgi:UDP-GlcNAc:undecaprenyl-phosphate GlcNAc-1-phosphate transferase